MKKIALYLLFIVVLRGLCAQPSGTFSVERQQSAKLPLEAKNLSVVGGNLYMHSGSLMLFAPLQGEYIPAFLPDTTMRRLGSDYEYIVVSPRDQLINFSYRGEGGLLGFFTHVKDRGRKNLPVPIRGWYKDICHPAFSPDGNMIIFSSQGKVGLGGYDLWCTIWTGKKWTKPVNMGNIINTCGNEINPVFYHNYLVYSTSGYSDKGVYQLCAVRVRPATKLNDVIFDNYVVQQLPFPFNSDSSDMEMAFDTVTHQGFWITKRNGNPELYSFAGNLDCVMLEGIVKDEKDRPVSGATVKALLNGNVVSVAQSDLQGGYKMLLAPEDSYQIWVEKENFYKNIHNVPMLRPNEELLIASVRHDVVLPTLSMNRPLIFDNIYRQGTNVELSAEAKAALSPVIEFVRDNPHVGMDLTLYCYQTSDEEFNNMVISRRINYLQQYMASVLPPECQILFKNGNNEGKIDPKQMGENTILIKIFDKR